MADERPAPPSGEEAVDMMARAVASGADFAGWLADILARTAARLGSSEALLAARPGSWEAGHVRGADRRRGRRGRRVPRRLRGPERDGRMTGVTEEDEIKPPPNVLLAGINGSTAYGLATEDSDVDRIGCYAAPTSQLHGLHLPIGKAASWVSTKPDATYHEAGKLAHLLLGGNPTLTELLFLDGYETMAPEGEALIGIRSAFLSAKAARNSYLGYAAGQFGRIRSRGDGSFSADTRKRTAKHARHLRRLLEQGTELHRTGRLTIRLTPEQAASCREFGERVAGGDLDLAERALAEAEAAFDAPGVLPDRPDESAAEAWLQDVRRAYWDRP